MSMDHGTWASLWFVHFQLRQESLEELLDSYAEVGDVQNAEKIYQSLQRLLGKVKQNRTQSLETRTGYQSNFEYERKSQHPELAAI